MRARNPCIATRFGETLPANHTSIAVARIQLGRVLVLQNRFAEAEPETLAGYRILSPQMKPSTSWL